MRLWRRTPAEREQRRIDRALALGIRGTIACDEVSLPVGFTLPSAGMYLDPRQIPASLMPPAMDAGQPAELPPCQRSRGGPCYDHGPSHDR